MHGKVLDTDDPARNARDVRPEVLVVTNRRDAFIEGLAKLVRGDQIRDLGLSATWRRKRQRREDEEHDAQPPRYSAI
jgi:hypothetical protein